MQAGLLTRFVVLVSLMLMTLYCNRANKEPLMSCPKGDPLCDFEYDKTDDDARTRRNQATPLEIKPAGAEPAGNEPEGNEPEGNEPEGNEPEGNKPEEDEPEGADKETKTSTNDGSENTEEGAEPIIQVQTGIDVKLILIHNDKNGVTFALEYTPFEGVSHTGFSIGEAKDDEDESTIEHTFVNTSFAKRVDLSDLRIPVTARYSNESGEYCAYFELSDQFKINFKNEESAVPAVSGECQ